MPTAHLLPPTARWWPTRTSGGVCSFMHTPSATSRAGWRSDYKGNPINEYLAFYELGVDGLFSDFADTAAAARVMYLLKKDPELRALPGRRPLQAAGTDRAIWRARFGRLARSSRCSRSP